MKKIVPALNKIQLVCQDASMPLSELGKARKELFAAIREALMEVANCSGHYSNMDQISVDSYLSKFDKLNGG